jgi:dihydropyrimidinase
MELIFSEGVDKGKISLNKMVDITSTSSAKIFGMFPKKGTIAVGSDADIVIFNPGTKHVLSASSHHHHCDYSAYEGHEVTGKAETVLLRGKVAIDHGSVKIQKGYGEFVKRSKLTNIL